MHAQGHRAKKGWLSVEIVERDDTAVTVTPRSLEDLTFLATRAVSGIPDILRDLNKSLSVRKDFSWTGQIGDCGRVWIFSFSFNKNVLFEQCWGSLVVTLVEPCSQN
ncbi:uncharacterized protein LOC132705338 [Cylas formicarius]|uniref:uncharacterized protein LOC132705338 n=1 Tax=Cylas formicarius TaxID=197179 RepID=UPI002958D179|nr:uncharacterized protein LOC132705338 [Cylas formicarius]XP_060531854.1 uncharacterized protein LOC132705338 [Cylas formicarius]